MIVAKNCRRRLRRIVVGGPSCVFIKSQCTLCGGLLKDNEIRERRFDSAVSAIAHMADQAVS
jgi:hypothetical protein